MTPRIRAAAAEYLRIKGTREGQRVHRPLDPTGGLISLYAYGLVNEKESSCLGSPPIYAATNRYVVHLGDDRPVPGGTQKLNRQHQL